MTRPFTLTRLRKPRGESLPDHSHGAAQLTFAASGMVQVRTEDGVWLVPPQLAAWIPAGAPHRLDILTDADLWMIFWEPSAMACWMPGAFPSRAFVSRVSPLLRSLLDAATAADPVSERVELMVRLILHELTATEEAPTFLPLPTGAEARRVADLALADHRNELDLDTLARRAATSVRTASRRFPEETGMTLKTWRQRARILWAMTQLGQGQPIARVARDAGFASTAAFSHAFRQVTTVTPSAFLESP